MLSQSGKCIIKRRAHKVYRSRPLYNTKMSRTTTVLSLPTHPPTESILAWQSFAEFLLSTPDYRQPQFAWLTGLYKFGMSGLTQTHPAHLKYSRNV